MKARRIEPGDRDFPALQAGWPPIADPPVFYALGDPGILHHSLLGLICSIQCPGGIIIKTFDLIRRLRDKRVVVIGGFHSPMERDCLDFLLRGNQPVIFCPARSLRNLRMGREARKAISEDRLLVLSGFGDDVRRTTAAQCILRNDMVAALADVILVPHAAENGKTWATVRKALAYGQKILTFEDDANADLIASGATACGGEYFDDFFEAIIPLKKGNNKGN